MKPKFCELPGLNRAYEEGRIAASSDATIETNPYPMVDTVFHAVWMLGWLSTLEANDEKESSGQGVTA